VVAEGSRTCDFYLVLARLARRVGWTAQTNPDKIEQDVAALLPAQ
jgi:endonuclease III